MKRTVTAVVLALVFSVVFCGAAWARNNIILNTVWPPTNYQAQALEELSRRVAERTNGEVVLVVETGGALGFTGPDILRAVRDGILPMSEFILSAVDGDEGLFGIYSLPFLFADFEEALIFHEVSRPVFQRVVMERWNQKILYLAPWPFACLWTNRPVSTLEDMRGLITRTYDRSGALFMEGVGATPLALPFAEVYTALATRLIDSVLTSTQTAVDASFWEVLDYLIPLRMKTTVSCLTINLDIFNELTPEQQTILIDTAKEMEEELWVKTREIDIMQEGVVNERGIQTLPITDEFLADLKAVAQPIIRDWLATSEEGTRLYEDFRAALENR